MRVDDMAGNISQERDTCIRRHQAFALPSVGNMWQALPRGRAAAGSPGGGRPTQGGGGGGGGEG